MATRQSSKVAAGVQPRGLTVGINTERAVYSVGPATSLSAGDVIQMIKVPKGAQVIYVAVGGGSGDALVAVGDGVLDTRYSVYSTLGSALPGQKIISTANVPYVYSIDDTLDIFVSTSSVGTITGGFNMVAQWVMDGS